MGRMLEKQMRTRAWFSVLGWPFSLGLGVLPAIPRPAGLACLSWLEIPLSDLYRLVALKDMQKALKAPLCHCLSARLLLHARMCVRERSVQCWERMEGATGDSYDEDQTIERQLTSSTSSHLTLVCTLQGDAIADGMRQPLNALFRCQKILSF
jgi:hypothetical protein